jgi:hypothetical protein
MCGSVRAQALANLAAMELATRPEPAATTAGEMIQNDRIRRPTD